MIADCVQSMSTHLEKTDLIIRVVSRQTKHENMNDFNDLVCALRLVTNRFQLSFGLSYEKEAENISQLINLCTKQYCVIVAPEQESKVSFLVKSKDWNFIECADCKWDTNCPYCMPHFWF